MKNLVDVVRTARRRIRRHAADHRAGKAKVGVERRRHGALGASVKRYDSQSCRTEEPVQSRPQLKALRDGTRKNPIMGTIAAQ